MKTIIAGSREGFIYSDVLKAIESSGFQISEVVCGGARGVDSLGEKWAKENGVDVIYFLPDWEFYGKLAGILRNKSMANYADALIALWDGSSKGTKNMIDEAKKRGLKTFVYLVSKTVKVENVLEFEEDDDDGETEDPNKI